jgi:hypothetical protein
MQGDDEDAAVASFASDVKPGLATPGIAVVWACPFRSLSLLRIHGFKL